MPGRPAPRTPSCRSERGRRARALCGQSHHHERSLRGPDHHGHRLGGQAARRDQRQRQCCRALQRLAAEAVQIARISPVHREYVPTLGPLEYPDSRGFTEATADVDVARAPVHSRTCCARVARPTSAAPAYTRTNASAIAVATANGNRRYFRASEAACSITARTEDGTGSGYYAGDHFDVRAGRRRSRSHGRRWRRRCGRATRSRSSRACTP